MNVLPVRPQMVRGQSERDNYFNDLDAMGFCAACITSCSSQHNLIHGEHKDTYFHFAAEAVHRGCLACVSIDCSLSAGDDVEISQAQRDLTDKPLMCGDDFFVSPASRAWKSRVNELVEFFVRDLGYQCIVLKGFEFRMDIPGHSDPFAARFATNYPDVRYPSQRDESTEYLMVQQEKARVVMDFCSEVAAHAKAMGARHVGLATGPFVSVAARPTNGLHNPTCDSTLLAKIPDIDFVVTDLNPVDVLEAGVQTGGSVFESPAVFYTEVLAHASGKSAVAMGRLASACGNGSAPAKAPYPYVRDCVNSAVAAAPCGFGLEWTGAPLAEQESGKLFAEVAEYSGRLGQPTASVAFVYSYSGTRHVHPYSGDDVFQAYWALSRQMALNERLPMLTFHAETLQQDLIDHPEVQVLVFDDHFPLSVEQMMVIRNWWQGSPRRAAVAFGNGQGYSADVNTPGLQPSGMAYPGIMELIGLKQEEPYVLQFDTPADLLDVSRVRRSAFLGDGMAPKLGAVAGVKRVFGSRANVLYEVDYQNNRVPVVAEWRDRTTLAIFCGFGLSNDTADMAVRAIRYALREVDAPHVLVDSCTDGIVWSVNRHDYVVVSNLSDSQGSAVARPGRANFWDCKEKRMLPDGDPQIVMNPHSSRTFRMVGRRSKFLDVVGCSCLHSVSDGAGRAEIDLVAGKTTTFILRSSPKEIMVDGRPSIITQEVVDNVYYVTLQQCSPGDRRITLRW